MRRCLLLVVSMLVLWGCGDTTIAFCSGGDDHCDNFFLKLGDEDDDDEEPDPEPAEEPPADGAAQPTRAQLRAALKIARLTPQPIQLAIENGTMENLVADAPELPGLWLIQASLGRLVEPDDNAGTTRFLDQNRAWLPAQPSPAPAVAGARAHPLRAGLELFAAFAVERDPASAAAGRALAEGFAADAFESPAPGAMVAMEIPGRFVVAAARAPERCCTTDALSAAAVILCAASAPEDSVTAPSRERACTSAALWFDRRVSHGSFTDGGR